jgi:hypothetical protein
MEGIKTRRQSARLKSNFQNKKIDVAYEDIPAKLLEEYPYDGVGVVCETCSFWEDPNKCTVVEGKISPKGCCILYAWDGKVNMDFISGPEAAKRLSIGSKKTDDEHHVKISKTEAGYLKPLPPKLRSPLGKDQASFGCHSCFYFDGKNKCELVEGQISPWACCNLWSYEALTKNELQYEAGYLLKIPEQNSIHSW